MISRSAYVQLHLCQRDVIWREGYERYANLPPYIAALTLLCIEVHLTSGFISLLVNPLSAAAISIQFCVAFDCLSWALCEQWYCRFSIRVVQIKKLSCQRWVLNSQTLVWKDEVFNHNLAQQAWIGIKRTQQPMIYEAWPPLHWNYEVVPWFFQRNISRTIHLMLWKLKPINWNFLNCKETETFQGL